MHFSSTPHLLHSKVALHLHERLTTKGEKQQWNTWQLTETPPSMTYIPSHYLNGQNTSHGQAAVQGLLGRDTYVPSEWVWHLKHFCHWNSEPWRSVFLMSARTPALSFHGIQIWDIKHMGARDTEECFSRNSTVLMARNYVQVCRLPTAWNGHTNRLITLHLCVCLARSQQYYKPRHQLSQKSAPFNIWTVWVVS